MSKKMLVVGCLVAGLLGPTPAPNALAAPVEMAPLKLQRNGKSLVRIRLTMMPPTRTFCTADVVDSNEAVLETWTASWDPLQPGELSREAVLPELAQKGDLLVSCWSEAARHSLDANADFAWRYVPPTTQPAAGDTTAKLQFSVHKGQATREDQYLGTVSILDKGGASRGALPSLGLPGAIPGGLRALGPFDDAAVGELFKVIAEVVVERAKTRGMLVLQRRLQAFCKELEDKQIPMTHTCRALGTVRIDDLAGVGENLLRALARDFVDLAVKSLDPGATDFKRVLDITGEVLVGTEDKLSGVAERVLIAVLDSGASGSLAAGVRDMLAQCQRRGGCDAQLLAKMAANPGDYLGSVPANSTKEVTEKLLVRGLAVLRPKAGTTESERLVSALDLTLDLTKATCPAAAPGAPVTTLCAALVDDVQREQIRDLLQAIGTRNLQRLVPAAVSLMMRAGTKLPNADKASDAVHKIAKLGAALTSYLSTYADTGKLSAEDKKARHEAQKKAIESIADAFASRRERAGDTVFSVGSLIGMSWRGAWGIDSEWSGSGSGSFQYQPAILSLGLALDAHSRGQWGFHMDLAPFDLGSYLTATSDAEGGGGGLVTPSGSDAISPSLMLGVSYLFKEEDVILTFGPRIGIVPKFDGDGAGRSIHFGGVLGVYVPLFDFN